MATQTAPSVIDKRQTRPREESATEFLGDFPALVALSRLAVPILAVDDQGAIEFANEAFAAMIGHPRHELATMTAQSLVDCLPSSRAGVVSVLREHANTVIRLRHAEGWTMPALVSDSVLIRENEKLAVVAFTDLTEIAWHASNDDWLPG